MDEAKPFNIPKREVWEAFKKVKANQGAAGVDGQSIADFEADLSNNLYKLWNRLSSGSYFPPPVRRVEFRRQMAVRARWAFQLSPTASPRKLPVATWSRVWSRCSHRSYGYRPGNQRSMPCAKLVSAAGVIDGIDIDVKAYFDGIVGAGSGQFVVIRTCLGCCSLSSAG